MAADEYTWDLEEIRDRWREDTGRSQTADISDANANKRINDYYVNHFGHDAKIDEFDIFVTQALAATDSGEYTISTDIDRLDDPATIDGDKIILYRDQELFFDEYPENEQYITAPGLAIGVADTTKVYHAAFDYRIEGTGYAYSKASSEITLSGDTIPQNKYGAFSFTIDDDGDIAVTAADDNDTGYDSPKLALEDLGHAASDTCFMGYLVVKSTDSGGFIPGTTALDDSAVTDTYTDGKWETRRRPEAACLFGTKLYVRPKPNDIYQFKARSIGDRPAALSSDDDAPTDKLWGPAIARGAAILYLAEQGETERIDDLAKSTSYLFNSIKKREIKRLLGGVIQRRY